jgi:hypothetical protein
MTHTPSDSPPWLVACGGRKFLLAVLSLVVLAWSAHEGRVVGAELVAGLGALVAAFGLANANDKGKARGGMTQ